MTLTVGSLFSGIGGLDLGLERAGMTVLWQSEIDPYACRVLQKHWPHVPNLGDVRTINWETVPYVDVIAGGYPCQPFSLAGDRRGADDPRHLWPYMATAIRRVRPRFALLENVAGHLTLGFGTVLGELAACGYDAQWDCIPAAAVGAPHRRDRLFVIATRRPDPHADTGRQPGGAEHGETQGVRPWPSPMADPDDTRLEGRFGTEISGRTTTNRLGPTPSPRPRPREPWEAEPDICRMVDGIPYRMDRLRGLGNAVVPQVAEYLGRIIRGLT